MRLCLGNVCFAAKMVVAKGLPEMKETLKINPKPNRSPNANSNPNANTNAKL